jgi:hypothetical protein
MGYATARCESAAWPLDATIPIRSDEGARRFKSCHSVPVFLIVVERPPTDEFGPFKLEFYVRSGRKFERVHSERLALHTSSGRSCYPEYERRIPNIALCNCS